MPSELDPMALEALKNHQRQLDADGCEVGVSRQALDELIAAYESRPLASVAEAQPITARHLTPEEQKTFDAAWRASGNVRQVLPLANPAPSGMGVKVKAILDEGLEILNSLIDSVKRHGNYSPESTCMFINQAGQCIRKALTTLSDNSEENHHG